MNLVFLGKQGVGKGTYAQRVAQKYSVPQISTGDLLRSESKKPTPLGQRIFKILKSGQLVNDQIVLELLTLRLADSDAAKGFVLDGFPRTHTQAIMLEELTNKMHRYLDLVVLFSARDNILLARITGRRQCRLCGRIFHLTNLPPKIAGVCDVCGGELYQREDDKEEAIRKRFEIYEAQTKPLVDFYRGQNLLFELDASGDVNTVMVSLYKKLDELNSKKSK